MRRPSPAWPLSLSVLLLAAGVALSTPALASTRAGDLRKKDADETKSDAKGDDAQDAKKDDKEQPKEPAFDKVVKGTKTIPGLFNVYLKEDEAKFYLEIAPAQLDVPFLLNPTLVSGIGQGFLYPSDMLQEYVVAFHRNGKTMQLIHLNTLFRADDASSMRRPASLAAPDAIVGQTKIESQPHPDRKSVLVDLAGLFLGDLEGMGNALKQVLEAPYGFDRDGSSVTLARGFPDNVDFETLLHFRTSEVKKPAVYAADARSLLVRFHYAISKLPQTGYRPRLRTTASGISWRWWTTTPTTGRISRRCATSTAGSSRRRTRRPRSPSRSSRSSSTSRTPFRRSTGTRSARGSSTGTRCSRRSVSGTPWS